jgi:hypothetical protein
MVTTAATAADPNLFVIGAPRCGTTSLYAALKQHPAVHASVLKEPHHYAADLPVQPHTVVDREDYLELFRGGESCRYRAEASVWYLYSPRAAEAIAEAHPDARVVVLLRDPVEMALSLYALYLRSGNECETDPDLALMRTAPVRFERSYFPFGLHYRALLRYDLALSPWRSRFDATRMRVMFYEEFYADPAAAFADLCAWLEIDPTAPVRFDRDGAAAAVRMTALRQLRALPAHLRAKLNPQAVRLHSAAHDIRPSLRTRELLHAEAAAGFAPLRRLLGRPLPAAWEAAAATAGEVGFDVLA